jgi:Na+/H+ antiporter NhaD/arsenite permease-like protein
VIAANAGGAWSPMGDVTTTMLWIGGQITALNIIRELILPSIVACALPLLLMSRQFKGINFIPSPSKERSPKEKKESNIILVAGIILLVSVPIFKTTTHLPPFMGMLGALSIIWIINSLIHKKKEGTDAEKYTVAKALQRIDTPSILFFLGILLAVAALQSYGILKTAAVYLSNSLHNDYLIGIALGLLSSIVDNVPLVAAAQGMYDLSTYPTDHPFWEFLAFTTGTGGSAIIIGSAAGVAVMGIEQIDFIWYFKKISWLAIIGFIAGVAVFLLEDGILF